MRNVFITGFPGFLASELLPRVLARAAAAGAVCLVQPKYAAAARVRADELTRRHPTLAGRIHLVDGDITEPGLGLGGAAPLAERITDIYHLAAIYDLSVVRAQAMRVNVDGTAQLLDFARRCRHLDRLHYVSTCFVSGRHPGLFTEAMLEHRHLFNNAYEETKYLAEVLVQRAAREGLPITIYRPAIVVGDSRTGATQKFDGPYFLMQWLLRQPSLAMVPVVGDPRLETLNVVPRDFVVDAMAYLSARPDPSPTVYHLADPDPLTIDAVLNELARSTGRRLIRIPVSLRTAKFAIERVPGVQRLMRIPSASIDYLVHPTRYGTAATESVLAASGIRCPRLPEYVDRLVQFAREHPDVSSAPMA